MAEHHYATLLGNDEAARRIRRDIREKWAAEFQVSSLLPPDAPQHGLNEDEFQRYGTALQADLKEAQSALARGNIDYVVPFVEELLDLWFRVRLDRSSSSYRHLAAAVLAQHVKALQAIQRRQAGEPIETPRQPEPDSAAVMTAGESLRAAFKGWQKHRDPSQGTLAEYERAIRLFTELHSDLPVADIKRRHAREFREALRDVPRLRTGDLLKASLPELAEWGRAHPHAPRLSKGTINKLIGGVQAIAVWARDQGIIPDDVPWSDPFARMRLEEDEPDREPFNIAELKLLFASPVFTREERPEGGKGEAAFWLPLLGLFTGARRGELAGLTAADVVIDEATGHCVIIIREDESRSRSLKTRGSARTIPLHPELIRQGFMQFVEQRRRTAGPTAWLFPEIAPDHKGGLSAWTKWFSRYLRAIGITDPNKVFHSFRHLFKDALRAAKVPEDLNDALMGQATRGSVGRRYGARDIVTRYGMPTLIEAVERVAYSGLDLSGLRPSSWAARPQGSRPTHGRRKHH